MTYAIVSGLRGCYADPWNVEHIGEYEDSTVESDIRAALEAFANSLGEHETESGFEWIKPDDCARAAFSYPAAQAISDAATHLAIANRTRRPSLPLCFACDPRNAAWGLLVDSAWTQESENEESE